MKFYLFYFFFFLLLFIKNLIPDTLQKTIYNTTINWTNWELQIEVQEPLPKIVHNEPNLDQQRNIAYERAMRSTLSRMSVGLESIVFNENYTLGEYLRENKDLMDAYLSFFNSNPGKTTQVYNNNYLVLKTKIKILGTGNLLSLFYNEWGGDDLPEIRDYLPEEKYTGFLIDARDIKLQPSLFPKIQLEDGRDILNKEIAYPNAIQERGLVLFIDNESSSILKKRIGDKPLRIPALYITGKNQTNFVVPFREVQKVLSSPTNRHNWRLCKIAVLISSPTP